jgi:hypothetical protein
VLFVGAVELDRNNIKDLDPTWLRTHIGTVSQVSFSEFFSVVILQILLILCHDFWARRVAVIGGQDSAFGKLWRYGRKVLGLILTSIVKDAQFGRL